MAVARVVTFEGVDRARIDELRQRMDDGEQPDGLNATELMILHDADAEKSIAIVLFDNEADYAQGNAILDAMPADETPGRRTSVSRFDVAVRMTR